MHYDPFNFETALERAKSMYLCHLLYEITKVKYLNENFASHEKKTLLFVTPKAEKEELEKVGEILIKCMDYRVQDFDLFNLQRKREGKRPYIQCSHFDGPSIKIEF